MTKTVALCLGSGGARGYTHMGVIDELEARGYKIITVSGCSIGALVGGFYCADKLAEYREWVVGLTYFDVLKMMDISFVSGGMIRGNKLFNVIDDMLGDLQIEDLRMPFTAVATDLSNYKEVWFQHGPLAQAVRASSAIPGMFSPVQINGSLLVDGAVLNPLPITPCVSARADLIIAVDLSADVPNPMLTAPAAVKTPPSANDKPEWFRNFVDKANGLLSNMGSRRKELGEQEQEQLGKLGVLNRVVDVMSSSLTQYKIAGYPPDLLVKMPRSCCETYDFHRAEEMIDLGRHVAAQALDAYEAGSSCIYGQKLN